MLRTAHAPVSRSQVKIELPTGKSASGSQLVADEAGHLGLAGGGEVDAVGGEPAVAVAGAAGAVGGPVEDEQVGPSAARRGERLVGGDEVGAAGALDRLTHTTRSTWRASRARISESMRAPKLLVGLL